MPVARVSNVAAVGRKVGDRFRVFGGSGRCALFAVAAEERLSRADLEWGRLTGWREAVAQIFEDSTRRKAAQSLEEIRIVHTRGADSPAVHYLSRVVHSILGGKNSDRVAARRGAIVGLDPPRGVGWAWVPRDGRDEGCVVGRIARGRSIASRRVSTMDGTGSVAPGAIDQRARSHIRRGAGPMSVHWHSYPEVDLAAQACAQQVLALLEECALRRRRGDARGFRWQLAKTSVRAPGQGEVRLESRASVLGGRTSCPDDRRAE